MPRTTKKVTRRQVMQGAAGVAAATYAGPALGALGANDRIRLAVAGINGRGKSHIDAFSGMKDVELAYLVDPDSRLFDDRSKKAESKGGTRPECVQDIRKVLEDGSIDAISIATPNHWHSLMTIWACQAGKDVYVEKPMSHNIREGRVAVEAARKYKRIVQHGTQRRSDGGWAHAAAAIASGELGKLKVARGLCYKKRGSIGFKETKAPPSELDFNLWLGPAAETPYHENLVHYNWHWFWATGNGDTGNQGVHQMDVARWGIPGAKMPKSVISIGGRLGYKDQGETPNTQITLFDYGDTTLIFETRGLPTDNYKGVGVGNIFHLEGGEIREKRWYPTGNEEAVALPSVDHKLGPGGGNYRNFIEAMRTRKIEDLNADIEEGHYSSALCHLCNVSLVLGEQVPVASKSRPFGANDDGNEAFDRMREHLAQGNNLDLNDTEYWIGRKLVIDQKSETFVNDPEANALLTREYRDPFMVPHSV